MTAKKNSASRGCAEGIVFVRPRDEICLAKIDRLLELALGCGVVADVSGLLDFEQPANEIASKDIKV